MRTAERKKVNVLEMKCLRSLVGGIKRCIEELDQRVLRWFGLVKRMVEYTLTIRVLNAEVKRRTIWVDQG